jgi:hypothetical protein
LGLKNSVQFAAIVFSAGPAARPRRPGCWPWRPGEAGAEADVLAAGADDDKELELL